MPDPTQRSPYPKTAIRIAVALAAVLVVGVAVTSVVLSAGAGDTGAPPAPSTARHAGPLEPLALAPVDAPAAGSPDCAGIDTALPNQLASGTQPLQRLPLAVPAPPATAAWGGTGEPIVLRCGLDRPAELTRTAQLREISGVKWLPITGAGIASWYVVDRSVYIALTIPDGAGTGPLQDISTVVRTTLAAQPVRPVDG